MINTYKDRKRLITLIFDTRAPKTDTHTGVDVRGQPNPSLTTANRLTGAWGRTRQKTNPMPANAASSSADAQVDTQPPAHEDMLEKICNLIDSYGDEEVESELDHNQSYNFSWYDSYFSQFFYSYSFYSCNKMEPL